VREREPLLQAFPFLSTLGEVTLHPLSPAMCLFTGKWVELEIIILSENMPSYKAKYLLFLLICHNNNNNIGT
jgi:hypothetical protein